MTLSTGNLIVINSKDHIASIRDKLKAAKEDLAKTPSYGNALMLQRLRQELNAAAEQYRRNNIKLVYNFEDYLLDKVVA